MPSTNPMMRIPPALHARLLAEKQRLDRAHRLGQTIIPSHVWNDRDGCPLWYVVQRLADQADGLRRRRRERVRPPRARGRLHHAAMVTVQPMTAPPQSVNVTASSPKSPDMQQQFTSVGGCSASIV